VTAHRATHYVRHSKIAIAVHGGAGIISREQLDRRRAARYEEALAHALRTGRAILEQGGSSLDAATAAVVVLEDNPLFNAGRGAVFNAAGRHELDAAVMEGATMRAGAVAAVRRTKNPVLAARAVMDKTPHVMLVGAAADALARRAGLEIVHNSYFSTAVRRAALDRVRKVRSAASLSEADRHGTVGAVALDARGTVAAATSTGGMTNKMPGRVGDSPVIGAGTYADNAAGAVSATGDGEYFIRRALAHDVIARMRLCGEPLDLAARNALAEVASLGGRGGLVAVDRDGSIAMPFTTEGMYRGSIDPSGQLFVSIFE
jgi:isoaspartyl peptidase/L-asparaginase-like protein (Ntn-hydrolase superfamily)